MSDKITREEMVRCFDEMCVFLAIHGFTEIDPRAVAIRKHLEKPEPVSRDDIDKLLARIYGAAGEYRGNKIVEIWLTELGIEVSDNSEVSRRTSDKEGE